MNTETFFTLEEYKQNYVRFKTDFVEAYEDNDEEEFISLQIEWYQKCLLNTELEWTVFDGDIDWFPKVFFSDKVVWKVIEKLRNENGGMNQTTAQNLSVSFKKILQFLREQKKKINIISTDPTVCQWALYYYVLQECKLKPPFKFRVKEMKELAQELGIYWKTFQTKYNLIDHSHGLEGYRQVDVDVVEKLLEEKHPNIAVEYLQKLTLHIS